MEKPYYKKHEEDEERRKESEANKELMAILDDPFKDPMEDLVDNLVAMADENQNATMQAAVKASSNETQGSNKNVTKALP
jgi:hypothetical protein